MSSERWSASGANERQTNIPAAYLGVVRVSRLAAGELLPQVETATMTLLLPGNDAKLEEAAAWVANQPHPSAIELQVHFKIRWDLAQNLANVLQERGLWPKCGHRQGLKRTCILFRGHIRGHVFEI